MTRLGRLLGSVFAALLAASCTDSGLQPHQQESSGYDDKLQVNAHLCTLPAADAYFPVKILFVVDTSDSMSVTDRQGIRAQAVADVMARFAGNPSVEFAVIAFDSELTVFPPGGGFTNSPDTAAIHDRLTMADKLTDYQGALGAAYTLLANDMQASNPADRARTKYVVVFFSDGTPDPQCSAEPTPCGMSMCPAGQVCSVGACKDEYLICVIPKEDWSTAFNPPLPMNIYPELMAGGDYNLPQQIFHSIDNIIGLQDFYKAGEVRVHTGFLFDPAAASDPLAAPFGLDHDGGAELLSAMAKRGNGTYTEFTSGTKISFLNIDYASIKEESSLAELIVTNTNAIPQAMGPVVDTDGDGISDDAEFTKMLCIGPTGATCGKPTDTDNDGYSDLLEDANRAAGFDPKDPLKPSLPCVNQGDSDGDGLADCEEAFLGTDTRLFDSDGDRITDLLELQNGLNPLDHEDALADDDHDTVRNIDEIRNHTNPHVPDVMTGDTDVRYRYDVANVTTQKDGSICYDFTIRNIQMLTTGKGTDAELGKNRIYVYFDQAPTDRPLDYGTMQVACIDTRYVNGIVKAPASGTISLDNTKLVPLAQLAQQGCINLTGLCSADSDCAAIDPMATCKGGNCYLPATDGGM
jgi:hypothetical protein